VTVAAITGASGPVVGDLWLMGMPVVALTWNVRHVIRGVDVDDDTVRSRRSGSAARCAWRAQVLAYFITDGVSNGGTEAINQRSDRQDPPHPAR
jgi:hypothetical protein